MREIFICGVIVTFATIIAVFLDPTIERLVGIDIFDVTVDGKIYQCKSK